MTSRNEPSPKRLKTNILSCDQTTDEPLDELKFIFTEIGIDYPQPDDFLTTENMFEGLSVKFNSISTYQLNRELSLTVGTLILTKPLNLSNGLITIEDADKLGIHLETNQLRQFDIVKISLVIFDLKIYVLIESTLFPYWRWRSLMNSNSGWQNGCRIVNPSETTSLIWLCSLDNLDLILYFAILLMNMSKNFEKHHIRIYQFNSLSESRNFLNLLKHLTPILNEKESTLKLLDVIQQTHTTSSIFICVYQQSQIRYKDLNLQQMNLKMMKTVTRMKDKATEDIKKLMSDLKCADTDLNEDFIFVKYRRLRDRVQPQVLIEINFNKFL